MGSVDNGNQILSYDYKEQGTSENFNKITYRLFSRGVYSGGTITRVNDSNVTIAPLIIFFEDNTNSVGVRIETTTNANLVVSSINMYIVARFVWQNVEDNYMDFLALPYAGILSTDVILGKLTYVGSVLSSTIDYSRKNWAMPYYINGLRETANTSTYNPPFKVVAGAPYSTAVEVYPGKAIIGGKIVTIGTITTSPSFTFPVSSNGRTDILTINSSGALSIITGDDLPGAPTPNIPINVLPIAKINFPALATTVYGNYIEYLNPMFTPVINDANTTNNAVNADLLDTYHAGNSSGQIPVSNGTLNTNLNADLHEGLHANNSTGNIPVSNGTVNTNLNADMTDGYHVGNNVGQIPLNNNTRNENLIADKGYDTTNVTTRLFGNASGYIPVSNGTVNTNLNADLLDGFHAGNLSGQIPVSNGTLNNNLNANLLDGHLAGHSANNVPINDNTLNTNLNADLLDGFHAGNLSGQIPVSNDTRNVNLVADKVYSATGTTNRSVGNAENNIPISNGVVNTNLNADRLDGYHSGNATGQIPVSNTTVNTDLNADLLDGYHAGNADGNIPVSNGSTCINLNAQYLMGYTAGNTSGVIPISNGTLNTNLNADRLDGYHASLTATIGNIPVWVDFGGQTTVLGYSQYTHNVAVGGVGYPGSLSATASTVVIRDSNADILAHDLRASTAIRGPITWGQGFAPASGSGFTLSGGIYAIKCYSSSGVIEYYDSARSQWTSFYIHDEDGWVVVLNYSQVNLKNFNYSYVRVPILGLS